MSLGSSVDDEIIKISLELKALESEAEIYKKEFSTIKQKRDEKNSQFFDLIKKEKKIRNLEIKLTNKLKNTRHYVKKML